MPAFFFFALLFFALASSRGDADPSFTWGELGASPASSVAVAAAGVGLAGGDDGGGRGVVVFAGDAGGEGDAVVVFLSPLDLTDELELFRDSGFFGLAFTGLTEVAAASFGFFFSIFSTAGGGGTRVSTSSFFIVDFLTSGTSRRSSVEAVSSTCTYSSWSCSTELDRTSSTKLLASSCAVASVSAKSSSRLFTGTSFVGDNGVVTSSLGELSGFFGDAAALCFVGLSDFTGLLVGGLAGLSLFTGLLAMGLTASAFGGLCGATAFSWLFVFVGLEKTAAAASCGCRLVLPGACVTCSATFGLSTSSVGGNVNVLAGAACTVFCGLDGAAAATFVFAGDEGGAAGAFTGAGGTIE